MAKKCKELLYIKYLLLKNNPPKTEIPTIKKEPGVPLKLGYSIMLHKMQYKAEENQYCK